MYRNHTFRHFFLYFTHGVQNFLQNLNIDPHLTVSSTASSNRRKLVPVIPSTSQDTSVSINMHPCPALNWHPQINYPSQRTQLIKCSSCWMPLSGICICTVDGSLPWRLSKIITVREKSSINPAYITCFCYMESMVSLYDRIFLPIKVHYFSDSIKKNSFNTRRVNYST